MKQDRREFLGTLAGGAAWAMLGGCATTMKSCQEAIANRPVRRNFATLAPDDPIIVAYRAAIKKMKELPPTDRRNWSRQAEIHDSFCPHGNWLFLPWHRAYLLFFERICRKLSGMADFALPYWNWSQNPSMPSAFFGGGSSNQLLDTNRGAGATTPAASASVGPTVLNSILAEPNFETFGSLAISATASQHDSPRHYGRLEGTPHNHIHSHIGGDMGGFMSPLDPIFWLHHNMIERCWVNWNFDLDHPNTEDRAWLDREFTEFCDENGNPVRVTAAITLLYPVLAYRYDDVGPGATSARAPRPDTKADQDAASRKAKSGAKIRLDVRKQFKTAQPVDVEIDKPFTVDIPVDPKVVRAGDRVLLTFDGASTNHTEDFTVHAFINKPDATATTPPEDPHFAGALSFFDHAGGNHAHTGASFVLDVGDVLKRLNIEGGTLQLSLVLVPFPGRQPKTRQFTVATTELRLAKDVIERQP